VYKFYPYSFVIIKARHSSKSTWMFTRLLDGAKINRNLADKIASDLPRSPKGQQGKRNRTSDVFHVGRT